MAVYAPEIFQRCSRELETRSTEESVNVWSLPSGFKVEGYIIVVGVHQPGQAQLAQIAQAPDTLAFGFGLG